MPLNIAQDFGFLTDEAKREKKLQYFRERWARIKDERNKERRQYYANNKEQMQQRLREWRRNRKARAA